MSFNSLDSNKPRPSLDKLKKKRKKFNLLNPIGNWLIWLKTQIAYRSHPCCWGLQAQLNLIRNWMSWRQIDIRLVRLRCREGNFKLWGLITLQTVVPLIPEVTQGTTTTVQSVSNFRPKAYLALFVSTLTKPWETSILIEARNVCLLILLRSYYHTKEWTWTTWWWSVLQLNKVTVLKTSETL